MKITAIMPMQGCRRAGTVRMREVRVWEGIPFMHVQPGILPLAHAVSGLWR